MQYLLLAKPFRWLLRSKIISDLKEQFVKPTTGGNRVK
jgi:hypothetical protein